MTAEMPPGSVIVTPGDMYTEIRDMGKKLDRLTTVIDPALTTIREDVADHESRLRSVEKRIWLMAGGAVAGGAGIAQVLPLLNR